MNPIMVAQARTARLVAEGAHKPRVAYSTATKPYVREHITMVEVETDLGGRYWRSMPDSEVDTYIGEMEAIGYGVSDIDHAAKCWCFKD